MNIHYPQPANHPAGLAYVISRSEQANGYKSGKALLGHCLTAHKGEFKLDCLACVELKRKQEIAQGV
jgi:hypothetical protein